MDLIKKNTAAAGAEVKDNQVDPLDLDAVIVPNICKIMNFYNLVSELCPNNDIKIVSGTVTAANAG